MKKFTCPNCDHEMPLLHFMKAGTPMKIKCPHCKDILDMGKPSWWIFGAAILYGLSVAIIFIYFPIPTFLIAMFMAAVIAEITLFIGLPQLSVRLHSKKLASGKQGGNQAL